MSEASDKHSPRLDEQLQHETEPLLRGAPDEGRDEWRRQQAPGPGEPDVALPDRALPGDGDDRLPEDELDRRARLAAALAPARFPTTATELTAVAEGEHLGDDLLDPLRALPADASFATVQDVWVSLGGAVEPLRDAPEETDDRG
jgi:hypothetical protein